MIVAEPKQVAVVEPGQECPSGWVQCEIGKDIILDYRHQAHLLGTWSTKFEDAILVAAAVEFCDRTTRRSDSVWKREFSLKVPVHEASLWNQDQVRHRLCEALNFLTGDHWAIEFEVRKQQALSPLPILLDLDLRDPSAVILPFSDGLDSLAVSILSQAKYLGSIVRVRVVRYGQSMSALGSASRQFVCFPFILRFPNLRVRENSFRSRGFTFTLAAGLVAYHLGSERVVIPESGQGVLGPSLMPVGNSHPDYRCHPRFHNKMSAFLESLLGENVSFTCPQLWHTKGETIAQVVETNPQQYWWAYTRSCWQDSRHASVAGHRRQCGVCSACLLRRMSLHSADITEDVAAYVAEDLTSRDFSSSLTKAFPRRNQSKAMRSHGVAGVLHLEWLAQLLHSCDSERRLWRDVILLSQCLNEDHSVVRRRLERLVSQHAQEWNGFRDSLGAGSFLNRWAERDGIG